MKKNITIQMSNGLMVNGKMTANVMNVGTRISNHAKEIRSKVKNLHGNGKTICDKMIRKIAAFYSKELEEEITPSKALLLIKAQIAFGAVILTSACAPLCLASAIWFTTACLKVKNYKEEG